MVQRLLSSNGINGNTVMPEQNSKKLASTLLQPRESKHNQSRGGGIFEALMCILVIMYLLYYNTRQA